MAEKSRDQPKNAKRTIGFADSAKTVKIVKTPYPIELKRFLDLI